MDGKVYVWPGTSSFDGNETDADGKVHHIQRTTCLGCGEVVYEMHIGCCGYGACGRSTIGHSCQWTVPTR